MTPTEKDHLVKRFLRGDSVTDISADHAVKRTTVEDVLREAIVGLAQLNQRLSSNRSPDEPINAGADAI